MRTAQGLQANMMRSTEDAQYRPRTQTTATLCFQSPAGRWGQAHRRYDCGITPVDTQPTWHSETRRALQTESSAPRQRAAVKLLIGHVRRYTHLLQLVIRR